MSTMKDLARIVSDRHDIPISEAESFVSEMFNLLKEGLALDEQVKIKGLGTFKVSTMQERKSVNVNTGQAIIIDSHDRISFTPDNSMKESVNKPFAHFETVPINDGVVFEDLEDLPEPAPLRIVEPVEEKATEQITATPSTSVVDDDKQEPIMVKVAESEALASPEPAPIISIEPTVIQETETTNEATTESSVEETTTSPAETTIESIAETSNESSDEVVEESELELDDTTPVSNEAVIAEEKDTDNTNSTENTMDYLNPSKNDNNISIGTAIFIAVIVFVVGIVIGRFTADMTYDTIAEKFFPAEKTVVEDKVEFSSVDEATLAKEKEAKSHNTAEKIDSARKIAAAEAEAKREAALKKAQEEMQAKKDAEEKAAEQAKKAAEKKAAEDKAAEQKTAKTEQVSTNYDSDPRIRLGAYRIVGVQKTVTVKAGQTLASISKAYFGPGMECYVEAINGVKEVKVGQTIKIPELKIKKKKKS